MRYEIKFVEETCHTYEVEADNKEDAKALAEAEYYCIDEDGIKGRGVFIGEEAQANDLISCEEVKI